MKTIIVKISKIKETDNNHLALKEEFYFKTFLPLKKGMILYSKKYDSYIHIIDVLDEYNKYFSIVHNNFSDTELDETYFELVNIDENDVLVINSPDTPEILSSSPEEESISSNNNPSKEEIPSSLINENETTTDNDYTFNIKFHIKNYKLIKNLNVELNNSNVYIISGQNEVGKSSILEAFKSLIKAKNDTKIPVSIGEQESLITGIIDTPDGNTYSVTMEAHKDGKVKFTMVNNKGIRTHSITSIRDIFSYQDFTAEEFVSWGKTAEGRKKQSEIFLKCLDENVRNLYLDLTEKEKINYDLRTPIYTDIAHYSKRLKEINITDTEKELISKDILEIEDEIKKTKTEYEEKKSISIKMQSLNDNLELIKTSYDDIINKINQRIDIINKTINDLKNEYNNLIEEKTDIERRYNIKKDEITKELSELNFVPDDILEEKYLQALEMEKLINSTLYKYQDYEEAQKKYYECSIAKQELDEKIESLREQKKLLIKNNPILEDIKIEDDCIYVLHDNDYLPLSDTQISQSKQMIIACKILLKLNSHFPILLVGRGESFDNERLKILHELAVNNKAIVLLEKVIPQGGLKVEALIEE